MPLNMLMVSEPSVSRSGARYLRSLLVFWKWSFALLALFLLWGGGLGPRWTWMREVTGQGSLLTPVVDLRRVSGGTRGEGEEAC